MKRFTFLATFLFFTQASVMAQTDAWQDTLNSIETQFETYYCFKDLKKVFFSLDQKKSMDQLRKQISEMGPTPNTQAARDALIAFYDQTRDIHVGARFNTSSPYSVTSLPFTVRSVGKNYYVTGINRNILMEAQYPFQIGDELVSLNGKPFQKAVDEFLPVVYAQKKTQQAMAEGYALFRYDVLGKSMPTGTATFTVKRQGTGNLENYTTNWITSSKSAPESKKYNRELERIAGRGALLANDERNEMTEDNPVQNYGEIGEKKPFFPALGKILWESPAANTYHAYIFEMENGKKAGFIRVFSYFPRNPVKVAVPDFYSIIDKFVAEDIAVLVYDQTNNGGGSLLHAYDLLSSMIDQPVKPTLQVQWIINETHFENGRKWSDLRDLAIKAQTDPQAFKYFQENVQVDKVVDAEFLVSFISECDFMLKHLAYPNHQRLAPPFPLEGVSVVKPRPGKNFTGPILMLVNELSISSADLTPALYQDLGRAVIFGSRTAGAGAYQSGFLAPANNPYELYYSTISFGQFLRPHGIPVENLGVMPQVPYFVTKHDIRNKMSGYRQAVLKTLQFLSKE
jgi:hypothetical protein